ncbi:transporter substrate-binding domain-containing protein [Nakamurella sp. GG22]
MNNVGRRKFTAAGATAVAIVLAMTGCGSSNERPNPSPSTVSGAASGGTLTIGIAFDQPGLSFKDGDTYTGFDVDTATYVAAALGVPAENITWKEANGDDRQNLLVSGEADLIVSTFSITDDRKKVIDFAGPYFEAHQDLLVRRNETDITSPEELNGRKLCSVTGTTSAANVKEKYQGEIQLTEFPTFSDCVTALANSKVDAVTSDDVILAGFAAEEQYRGKLKVVGKGFSDEVYGIGVKKGDTKMVAKVNAALQQYIEDGSWAKSLESTVRPSGYSIPDPPTPGTA